MREQESTTGECNEGDHRSVDGLPCFIGIGGQRCGSTTLWHILRGDDRLYLPDRKELHYFSNRDGDYRKDLKNYKTYFVDARDGHLIGEFTPNYLTSAGACNRIKHHLPKVKLIVVLRDPVSRAISHYNYRVMRGQEWRSMKRAMRKDMKRCVGSDEVTFRHHAYCQMGMYAQGLTQYREAFGIDQIMVLFTDELKGQCDDVRRRLGEFLGLNSELQIQDHSELSLNKVETHPRLRILEFLARSTLRRFQKRDGIIARGQCAVARRLLRVNSKSGTRTPTDKLRGELRSFFEADTRSLTELLEIDPPWALIER